MTAGLPTFDTLSHEEAEAILARHHIGRLAFSFRDRVDIQPISYVYDAGAIICRTGPGAKLTTLERSPWIAFQVDEVDGPFDWRSVVAFGTVYPLDAEGGARAQDTYARSLALFRTIAPDALAEGDPAPFRTVLLRIHVHEIHGRSARSSSEP